MKDTYTVDFGTFNDEPIQASLAGFVECLGDGYVNFRDRGCMEIVLSPNVKRILDVVILGSETCTGTALLLDSSSQIWFYNVPDAVDPIWMG